MWRSWTLLWLYVHVCWADVKSDHEVKSLPGLDYELNFKHYAGRLNVSKTRRLSYWFVESQGNKEKDPLLLWLNGGPGCSSLFGFLLENGPFVLTDGVDVKLKLKRNENAWNKFANVLYLETPAGVGFSQNDRFNTTDYNDKTTAADNVQFLIEFLKVFKEYKGREFYITGESYGGCFVPTLANAVLKAKDKLDLNLKGVAIGNGLVDGFFTSVGEAVLPFHGADMTIYKFGQWMRDNCPSGFDNFCEGEKQSTPKQDLGSKYYKMMKQPYERRINEYDINRPCFSGFGCGGNSASRYLGQVEVQRALHFALTSQKPTEWAECNMDLHYRYHWCDSIKDDVRNLLKNGIKVLYFYGETDTMCPFIIGDLFVHQIGKNPNTTVWFVDDVYAGTRTTFDGNLTYTTIADSGHMAAMWKPKQTARAVHHFINNIDDWNE